MQKPDMITDIFQLTKIVRGNDRGQIPLLHIIGKQAFYCLTHHRIQTVKGLVAEDIVRSRADSVNDGKLFFHSL